MTEEEVCPDETESAHFGPPGTVCPTNPVPFGLESGAWFDDPACSPIIGAEFAGHLGRVGLSGSGPRTGEATLDVPTSRRPWT